MGYHREPLTMPPQHAAPAAPARLVLVVGVPPVGERGLADCLAQRGLRCIFEPAIERIGALQHQAAFDAMVLDLSGMSAELAPTLTRVRAAFAGRLLVVADGDDEVDEVMAFELGADDYIRRPVSARRLRARLLAQLRPPRVAAPVLRSAPDVAEGPLAGWRLDTVHQRLERGTHRIALTGALVQLLQCLQQHAGRVVPRAELHERICPGHSDIRARTIDVYVHRLRKRLADEGVHEIRIEAVRGRGFLLQLATPAGAVPAPPALRAVT